MGVGLASSSWPTGMVLSCLVGALSGAAGTAVLGSLGVYLERKRIAAWSTRGLTNKEVLAIIEQRGFDVEHHVIEDNLWSRYEKPQEKLGEGASGIVWKIRRRESPHDVFAMKIVPKSSGKVDKGLQVEVECLRKLQHRHIVNIVETVETHKYMWIIMEYAGGGGLYDRILKMKHFSEQDAARIIKQVLKAVHYMHSYGVVHRDLKPENVLLMTDEATADVKVADFGLAVDFHFDNYSPDESIQLKEATTIKDGFCGSPICMAPEVASKSAAYGPQCDIWSVGCIAYELLTGHPPFTARTAAELFKLVQRSNGPTFNDAIWSGISDDARDLVGNLLVKQPSDRLSAREALHHAWFLRAPTVHMAKAHATLTRRYTTEDASDALSRATRGEPPEGWQE